MNETSLLVEYQKLCPGVTKVFVVPKISQKNRDTSYLYQLYENFLKSSSSQIKIRTFNALSLPLIFLSRLKFEKSILHYHWFEFEDAKSFVGINWKLFWIIIYRMMGGKIIWTVHNKYPHHNKYLFINKKIRRLIAKLANRLHIHCESAISVCSEILDVPGNKFFVVKHPEFPSTIIERNKSIENLNQKYLSGKIKPEDKIFLMFGAIAEYKGIKEVINIFEGLDKKNKLLIAGFIKRGNEKYFNELQSTAGKENIFIVGEVIPDDDVPNFFGSADCAIFNYRDVLTSGGVHLALAYKRPVIAPLSGCLKELRSDNINFFETDSDRNNNLILAIKKFAY